MPIEGELVVRVESRQGRVTAASARAERPRVASRVFRGRPAREAAPLARSLFSICGRSHAIAAQGAIEAIRGEASTRRVIRERRICAETLQEHAWRIFVDAPRLAGREPAIEFVADERRALATLLDTDVEIDLAPVVATLRDWSGRALLGWAPERFLAIDSLGGFTQWMREADTPAAATCAELLADDPALGASDVRLLSPGEDDWIGNGISVVIEGDADFEDRPHIAGTPRECGALARMARQPLVAAAIAGWGRGVGARLVARLAESALLIEGLGGSLAPRHGAVATGEHQGIGWAETARGLLMHAVTLDDGHIAGYRIIAPTEWNFHPEGAFTRGARELTGTGPEIDARVRRLILSLDPCVGVRYEAAHA